MLAARPAGALTREERLGLWFNDAKIGMMMHWGIISQPNEYRKGHVEYRSEEEWEDAVNKLGWSAEKVIGQAKKLRAKYISWVTYHGAMGQIRTWRSNLPLDRDVKTKRDFLGELIAAGKPEGIKIVVYLNERATLAMMGELIDNYPDLGGLWYDGWNKDWERGFAALRQKKPQTAPLCEQRL